MVTISVKSTGKHISLLFTILIIGLALMKCNRVDPKRVFADADLLIQVSDMPKEWVETDFTKDYPYDTEGAENLAYRYFQYTNTSFLVKAGEDVYRYRSPELAAQNYKALVKRYYTKRATNTTSWETPEEFIFTSSTADQWRFACAYSTFSPAPEFGNQRRICQYFAQYQEFVINFSITTEVNGTSFITMKEVETILEKVDQKANSYLGP